MLGFGKRAKLIFGTPNDRKIKATRPTIDKINALEPVLSCEDGLIFLGPFTTFIIVILASAIPAMLMFAYFRRLGWIGS